MRFKGLDLNLLLAFDALMERRSVTRAAEHMHLSQAAMSSALGRLRKFFGDDLLVVSGKRMYPTAFAQTLRPRVRDFVRQLDLLVSTLPGFEPATSQRVFRLIASDYVITVVLAPLVSRLAATAPGVRLEILLPGEGSIKQIQDGDMDLLITHQDYLSPDLPSELLFEERHVVVGCRRNPHLTEPLTQAAFLAAGHVNVSIGNKHVSSFADKILEDAGVTRRIEVTAPSFGTVPVLLRNTHRLAIMHERMARTLAARFDVVVLALPFHIPPLREMVQYHFARASDEGLIWLRRELQEIVAAESAT